MKEEKKLTMGPNDARCVIWAHFVIAACFLVLISYVNTKKEIIQKLVTEKDKIKKIKKLTYGPNNTSGVIWAHSVVTAHFSIDISYVKPKIYELYIS